MLSTHLASVSQSSVPPVLLHATTVSSISIRRCTALQRKYRQRQQTRGFRWGLWSSSLDPNFERELHRRHKVMKHKYAEALNRKMAWDWTTPYRESRRSLKNFMFGAWSNRDSRPGGRWVNEDDLDTTRRHCSGKAGRGIEDVEQTAMEHLLGRHGRISQARYYQAINDYKRMFGSSWAAIYSEPTEASKAPAAKNSGNDSSSRTVTGSPQASVGNDSNDVSYDIDPITNRKVPKVKVSNPGSGSPPRIAEIPVKTFKSYRSQFHMYSPPSEEENRTIHLDGPPPSKPIGEAASTVSSESKERRSESSTVEEDLDRYAPFKFNEPDGKMPEATDPVAESLSEYERDFYEPFRYNEPDGKGPNVPDPVAQGLKDFDRRSSGDWLAQEGFFDAPGAGTPIPTPKGQVAQPAPSTSAWRTHEASYESLDRDVREDLDLLRASDVRAASGKVKAFKRETPSERELKRRELEASYEKTQWANESRTAEEIAAAAKVKATRQWAQDLEIERSELLNHNAHARGKVEAKIAELEAEQAASPPPTPSQHFRKLTGNYVRDFPEEFRTSWTTHGSTTQENLVPRSATSDVLDSEGQVTSRNNDLENKVQSEENDYVARLNSFKQPDHSNAARIQPSLDRTDLPSKTRAQILNDPYSKDPTGLEICYADECAEKGEAEPAIYVSSYGCSAPPATTSESDQGRLVKLDTKKIETERKARDRALIREVRDIYESAYGTIDSQHRQSGLPPQQQQQQQQGLSTKDSEKEIRQIEQDIREGQYLINSAHLELAKVLAARAPPDPDLSTTTSQSTSPEPTVYKILAYDPIMQSINIAETTSVVPDTSSALTPADVLLRLSNPTKFFPHFKPLQEQGYEIASGGGDVLVFRKVRDSSTSASVSAASATSTSTAAAATSVPVSEPTPPPTPPPRAKRITNPIDGMQTIRPATGNFASPTGFVNHDLPEDLERERPLPPPPSPSASVSSSSTSTSPPTSKTSSSSSPTTSGFQSNLSVRREEPVFSGRKNEWSDGYDYEDPDPDNNAFPTSPSSSSSSSPFSPSFSSAQGGNKGEGKTGKGKGRATRRLILGAGWVAACTYAVGVVAEYFRTGGRDGRGPVGF